MSGPALPTLLLLPGTLCDARVFRHQQRALRGLARVEVADLHRLDDPVAWASRLLRMLPPRFSVAGFSLGGLLAQELLRQAPQRIERLALIASNARAGSPRGARRSAHLWRLWRAGGAQAVAGEVVPQYFPQRPRRRRLAPLVIDMARRTPAAAARAQFRWAAMRPEGLSALAAFEGPLCLVSGLRDRLCPPAWQREVLRARPQARWTALPRVGHFVPLEAAGRLNHALAGWLRSPLPSHPHAQDHDA